MNSRTATRRAWSEIGVMSLLILSYMWLWQGSFEGDSLVCIGMYVMLGVSSHLRRGESARQIGFGLAHAYQGIQNLPKITIVGAIFAGLYVLSGSLWLPMVLHAAVDVLQGRAVYEALRRIDGDTPAGGNNIPEASAF